MPFITIALILGETKLNHYIALSELLSFHTSAGRFYVYIYKVFGTWRAVITALWNDIISDAS